MPLSQPPDLLQDCLAKLNQALDLCLQSATAASAAGQHQLVLRAAREATRIVTLIHKMTSAPAQPLRPAASRSAAGSVGLASAGPNRPPTAPPSAGKSRPAPRTTPLTPGGRFPSDGKGGGQGLGQDILAVLPGAARLPALTGLTAARSGTSGGP